MCLSVRKSVPLQITLGCYVLSCQLGESLLIVEKYGYFLKPHECSHDLCAHNLIRECFGYCLLAFLQHVFLKFPYFVHVLSKSESLSSSL